MVAPRAEVTGPLRAPASIRVAAALRAFGTSEPLLSGPAPVVAVPFVLLFGRLLGGFMISAAGTRLRFPRIGPLTAS